MPKYSITTVDVGQQYDYWTVLSLASLGTKTVPKKYLCRCACGTEKPVAASLLAQGYSRSCGCMARELAAQSTRTHGRSRTTEYKSYRSMLGRCSNPRLKEYKRYGGRGIKVCDRWKSSFENFFADMGCKPSPVHTLDRFPDKNGNYEPGNCRWATPREQSSNTRRNVYATINGRTQSIIEWVREYGIVHEDRVYYRLRKGWDAEQALTIPSKKCVRILTPKDVRLIRQCVQERTMTMAALARRFLVTKTTIRDAVQRKTFKYV